MTNAQTPAAELPELSANEFKRLQTLRDVRAAVVERMAALTPTDSNKAFSHWLEWQVSDDGLEFARLNARFNAHGEPDSDELRQAHAQMASVRELVGAMQLDYERLQELRDEREALQDEIDDLTNSASAEYAEAVRALAEWDAENAEELADLESDRRDCESEDEARDAIRADALSVEVRSDWHNVGDGEDSPTEFRIVLCTGGPHVEIRGELYRGEPHRAWLEYNGWFSQMRERVNQDGDSDALCAYASVFYFGGE